MPPTVGPTAAASAEAALHRPMDFTRPSAGPSSSRIAREAGIIAAAPTPCRTRVPIRTAMLGATAHSSEATVNVPMPKTKSRRRPSTSAIRPAGASRAANMTA
ncbi:hypothetical protein GCM10025734_25000 [Kitasatospora paranensis]